MLMLAWVLAELTGLAKRRTASRLMAGKIPILRNYVPAPIILGQLIRLSCPRTEFSVSRYPNDGDLRVLDE